MDSPDRMSKLNTINLIEKDDSGIFGVHVFPNTHEGRVDASVYFHSLVGVFCLKHEGIQLTPPQIHEFWKARAYYGLGGYNILVIYSNKD